MQPSRHPSRVRRVSAAMARMKIDYCYEHSSRCVVFVAKMYEYDVICHDSFGFLYHFHLF